MAQITYDNKVALNSNPNIADINKVNDTDMNMIKNVVNANEAKILLAVASTAPAQCSEGDMYFNTSSKLIFTATGTDTWGNTGVAPTMNTLYIVLSSQTIYAYDGNTLVSVGGGSSSGGGESLPIGAIAAFAGSTAPDGYLICDGSAVSRTTYADLYTAIGTTYGSGDGSTTFNVPDIKGKVLVGLNSSDTDFDTLGETGGSKELQAHNHLIVDDSSKYVMYYKGDASGNINGQAGGNNLLGGSNAEYTGTAGTGNSGNLQPYIVINFIIKASKTTPIQAEVVNTSSNSQTDTYSCDYVNKLRTPTLFSSRNYSSSWATEGIIPSTASYLLIILNGEFTEQVFLPVSIAKEYTGSSPYFVSNKNGLIYQFFVDSNNSMSGLFRSEAGTNYSVNIYIL